MDFGDSTAACDVSYGPEPGELPNGHVLSGVELVLLLNLMPTTQRLQKFGEYRKCSVFKCVETFFFLQPKPFLTMLK